MSKYALLDNFPGTFTVDKQLAYGFPFDVVKAVIASNFDDPVFKPAGEYESCGTVAVRGISHSARAKSGTWQVNPLFMRSGNDDFWTRLLKQRGEDHSPEVLKRLHVLDGFVAHHEDYTPEEIRDIAKDVDYGTGDSFNVIHINRYDWTDPPYEDTVMNKFDKFLIMHPRDVFKLARDMPEFKRYIDNVEKCVHDTAEERAAINRVAPDGEATGRIDEDRSESCFTMYDNTAVALDIPDHDYQYAWLVFKRHTRCHASYAVGGKCQNPVVPNTLTEGLKKVFNARSIPEDYMTGVACAEHMDLYEKCQPQKLEDLENCGYYQPHSVLIGIIYTSLGAGVKELFTKAEIRVQNGNQPIIEELEEEIQQPVPAPLVKKIVAKRVVKRIQPVKKTSSAKPPTGTAKKIVSSNTQQTPVIQTRVVKKTIGVKKLAGAKSIPNTKQTPNVVKTVANKKPRVVKKTVVASKTTASTTKKTVKRAAPIKPSGSVIVTRRNSAAGL